MLPGWIGHFAWHREQFPEPPAQFPEPLGLSQLQRPHFGIVLVSQPLVAVPGCPQSCCALVAVGTPVLPRPSPQHPNSFVGDEVMEYL